MYDRHGPRDRDAERRTRPVPARREPHGLGASAILALQRTAGNHAVTAILARVPVKYVPDRSKMEEKVKTSTTKMTDEELADVVANLHDPYTKTEVEGARKEIEDRVRARTAPAKTRKPKQPKEAKPDQKDVDAVSAVLEPAIERIAKEAVALVDTLNQQSTSQLDFVAAFDRLKAIHAGIHDEFNALMHGHTYDQRALEYVRANTSSPLKTAISRAGAILKVPPEVTPRDELIGDQPVVYPGAKSLIVMKYVEPTDKSSAALVRPGLQTLKTELEFTDAELHHVTNALTQGYRLSNDPAGMVERWLKKLDEMAPLWPNVKDVSARAWLRKALLPEGTKLYTHYKGMYGELWETHRVLSSGEFKDDTEIRMGKDKLRPEAPGMKHNVKKPTTTQDIDLSFHGADGRRHYHEVKADPDTIVSKIGGDEAKGAVIPDPIGPVSDELKKTPDQVLSYASARDHHELKPGKSPERYPGGKHIVLMYVSPNTRNWLRIFTTKAGRRLIDHGFELRLGAVAFDATQLAQVQARVDLLAPTSGDERNRWAITNSGAATSPFYDPAAFLDTL